MVDEPFGRSLSRAQLRELMDDGTKTELGQSSGSTAEASRKILEQVTKNVITTNKQEKK